MRAHIERTAIPDSRLQTKYKTPLPPASGGIKVFEWAREIVEVRMGAKKRLPGLGAYHGARAGDVAHFLCRQGFDARVLEAVQ